MKKHLVFWACATIVLALSCLVWTAAGQNNDNGGVMPVKIKYVNVDGVGGIEYEEITGTYHGNPVTAYIVSIAGDAPLAWISGVGFLPIAVLNKLDGGMEPATAGVTGCWECPTGEIYTLPLAATGPSLSAAVASLHEIVAAEITAGWNPVACP